MNTIKDMFLPIERLVSPIEALVPSLTLSGSKSQKDEPQYNVSVKSSLRGSAEVLLDSTTYINENLLAGNSAKVKELPDQKMTLLLLQGRNLPNDAQVRIFLLKSGENVGSANGTSSDPIWGGPSYSWNVVGNKKLIIQFQLLLNNTSHGGGEEIVAEASIPASSLLHTPSQRPNVWIQFANDIDAQIQVRLSKTSAPRLHQQENCENITSGPSIPWLSSYRIRKNVMWSCTPVVLNVYDVSNNTRIENVNKYTKAMGAGGIFHAAIEVFGKEYSFGGTRNRKSHVTGVFSCAPKSCPMHHYRESVYLGDCALSPAQVERILEDLKPLWLATSYNLFRKNCCFFSREFAVELGVGDIPEWVYSLATKAEFIEPYAIKLATYLDRRQQTGKPKTTDATNVPQPAQPSTTPANITKKETSSPQGDTQEIMLDHVMAARIQRSVRRVQSVRNTK